MRRLTFVAIIGCVAVLPFASPAQRRPIPVVGFLHSASAGALADLVAAFRKGLEEGGFREDQNVTTEYRWADDNGDRLPALAENLSRSQSGSRCHSGRGSQRDHGRAKDSGYSDCIGARWRYDARKTCLRFGATRWQRQRRCFPHCEPDGKAARASARVGYRNRCSFAPMTALQGVSPVIQAAPYFNNVHGKVIDLTARYANSGEPREGRIRHGRWLDELRN